jgi:hypothetical protein
MPYREDQFDLFADYFQFYLQDDDTTFGDLSDSWDDDATTRLLAVAPGTVGIGTVRYSVVGVTLVVSEDEPKLYPETYDNVVEADLEITTGQIVVAGCTDYFSDARRIQLRPGTYRVRSCGRNLARQDSYEVFIWPSPLLGVQVVKQFVAP